MSRWCDTWSGLFLKDACTHAKSPWSDKWMTPLNWNHWPWDLCLLTPEMVLSSFQLVGGWFWPLRLNSANHRSNCFGAPHTAFPVTWTLSLQWPSWRPSASQEFIWKDLAHASPVFISASFPTTHFYESINFPPYPNTLFYSLRIKMGFYHPDTCSLTSNPSIENLHKVYKACFASFNTHTE